MAKAEVTITEPKFQIAEFLIEGDAPLVMNAFPSKAKAAMRAAQEGGGKRAKGKKEPKDFDLCYRESSHQIDEKTYGIPASAFRSACISACRVAGFPMTRAKLSIFIIADGYDKGEGTPLVAITKGKPKMVVHHVRNETGVCDLRPRAMWDPGWQAKVRIRYDTEQFQLKDVAALLMRVGLQVGILEGRADSKKSCGMGWGSFVIVNQKEKKNEKTA